MLVVVAHAGLGHIIPGGSGVTIFFSISGFIIMYLLLREREKTGSFSVSQFYLRRCIKIVPPLLVAVVIPSLIFSMFEKLDWGAFLGQVFFFFNWFKIDGSHDVMPGTDVVWSLSIEEQFYILFALMWLIAVRSRYWRALTASVALLCVLWSMSSRMILATDPDMTHRIYYGSDTRIEGIALGVLAAIAYHSWQQRGERPNRVSNVFANDWSLVAAIVMYVVSLLIRDDWFRDTFRFTLQSAAACIVIVYGLTPGVGPMRKYFYQVSQMRIVQLIGLASYSIYLVHLSVANAIHVVFQLPPLVEVPFTVMLGVIVGIALYKWIEVPIHSARAAKNNQRTLARSTSA